MTELHIFKTHQRAFLDHLSNEGYSGISLQRHRFALDEFTKFTEANLQPVPLLFSDQAITQFIEWKLSGRRVRKYHHSYRARISGSLKDYLGWMLEHSNKTRFDKSRWAAMSRAYIQQRTPPYPRWPIEIASKHQQFFDYLEDAGINSFRKISLSTISNFNKKCERSFYKQRQYSNEYVRSALWTPTRNYFTFLDSKKIISFKDPDVLPRATLLDSVLSSYIELCCEAQGQSAKWGARIEQTLRQFSGLLDSESVRDISAINIGHVDQYTEYRKGGRPTILTENAILRRFLKWLYLEGHLASDISQLIISPRVYAMSKVPDFLTDDELKRILDFRGLSLNGNDGLCRAVVELLLFTGLRIGEAGSLELDDIHWKDQTAVIKNRKNGRDLLAHLPAPVIKCLRRYIADVRPKAATSRRVFYTIRAPIRPATPRGLSATIARYFRKKGVRGGAHRLRHTFAQRLLDSGSSLEEVQSLLGQESVNSTRIYAKTSMVRMRRFVVGGA